MKALFHTNFIPEDSAEQSVMHYVWGKNRGFDAELLMTTGCKNRLKISRTNAGFKPLGVAHTGGKVHLLLSPYPDSMSFRPHIALYVPTPVAGGAEKVFVNLARGFAQAGHPVDLLLARRERLSEVPEGVRVISFESKHVSLTLFAVARYLHAHRPAVLFSALFTPNVVAVVAKYLVRVPTRIIITEHTTFSQAARHASSLKARLLIELAKRVYPYADSFVAVSKGVASDLVSSVGIDRGRLKVIYNPIPTPTLQAAARKPAASFPWSDASVPLLVGAGRFVPQKDFRTLIEAWVRLRRRRPLRLVLLGHGPQRALLKQTVALHGLEEDVHMPGFVENPYAYFKEASVLALSSRCEGFGNVLVEAMTCGTPVVSTDCPHGPAEILDGGRFGPLVPVGDAEALAEAIERMLESPPSSFALEQRARDFGLKPAVEAYLEAAKTSLP